MYYKRAPFTMQIPRRFIRSSFRLARNYRSPDIIPFVAPERCKSNDNIVSVVHNFFSRIRRFYMFRQFMIGA